MRGAIDKAGRLVIPKPLRDQVGMTPGEVDLVVDGTGIRVEPVARDDAVEQDGRLVIPESGTVLDDEAVRRLRDADQR